MTQVNLLPPEIRRRLRVERQLLVTVRAAGATAAVLVLVIVLLAFALSGTNRKLDAQRAENLRLSKQVATLAPFARLRAQIVARQVLVDRLLQGQVLWSAVLQNVSMIIPEPMYLTSLTGTLNNGTGSSPQSPTGPVGAIQFQGISSDQPAIADWLTNLEEITGWVNPWISNDTRTTDSSGSTVFQFTGTLDLTGAATSPVRPR